MINDLQNGHNTNKKKLCFSNAHFFKTDFFLEEEKLKKDTLTTSRWKYTRNEKEMT